MVLHSPTATDYVVHKATDTVRKEKEESAPVQKTFKGNYYLSGPMSLYKKKGFNYDAFNKAAMVLRGLGYTIFNPAESFGGRSDLPREKYLPRHDLQRITSGGISGLVVLNEWHRSEGSRLEVATAQAIGLPVYNYRTFAKHGPVDQARIWGKVASLYEIKVEDIRRAKHLGWSAYPHPLAKREQQEAVERRRMFNTQNVEPSLSKGNFRGHPSQLDGSPPVRPIRFKITRREGGTTDINPDSGEITPAKPVVSLRDQANAQYEAAAKAQQPIIDQVDAVAAVASEITQAHKESINREADRIINGPRRNTYGHPTRNFDDTARLWSVIFDTEVTPEQVGWAMIALKMARAKAGYHRDNLVDTAGYAGTLEMIEAAKQSKTPYGGGG